MYNQQALLIQLAVCPLTFYILVMFKYSFQQPTKIFIIIQAFVKITTLNLLILILQHNQHRPIKSYIDFLHMLKNVYKTYRYVSMLLHVLLQRTKGTGIQLCVCLFIYVSWLSHKGLMPATMYVQCIMYKICVQVYHWLFTASCLNARAEHLCNKMVVYSCKSCINVCVNLQKVRKVLRETLTEIEEASLHVQRRGGRSVKQFLVKKGEPSPQDQLVEPTILND